MLCKNCNREMYERYNGKPFCPKCGDDSFEHELTVTSENEELFRLSELAYFRYLTPLDGTLRVKKPERLLDDAIHLCSIAASSGHPKAIFRMGYYYEFYHREEKSEIERFCRAFECYWRLCNSDAKKGYFQLLDGKVTCTSLPSEYEWSELQEQAARHILELMETSPQTFADSRYILARQQILKTYPQFDVMRKDGSKKNSRVMEIYRVLSSCMQKKRPPLLGLFKMSGADLRELLSLTAGEGRKHDVRVLCEKLKFHYTPCKEDGSLNPAYHFFDEIHISDADLPVRDEDYVYFFFFNKSGEHTYNSYLRPRDLHSMERVLTDQSELIHFIEGSSKGELLLFHEDIVYMKRVLKGSFATLIDCICREG